jgi:hypothetical protein
MSNSGKSKAGSLKWAIDELSKQREDLDAKLKIALKRDETNSLIEEVFAQKKALEQRISALEDGLRVSSELVDVPCSELESEMSKIDEKLDIAKERLQAIEQEEYLEELGKALNRSHLESSDSAEGGDFSSESTKSSILEDLDISPPASPSTVQSPAASSNVQSFSSPSSQPTASTSTSVMKSTTNRIQEQNIEAKKSETPKPSMTTAMSLTALSLEGTAQKLGIEPEFLADKGINAILRMIARNGGKLSFPLEVEQID